MRAREDNQEVLRNGTLDLGHFVDMLEAGILLEFNPEEPLPRKKGGKAMAYELAAR